MGYKRHRAVLVHKDNIMAKKTQHIAGSHIVETQKPYELMLVFKPDILESALEKKLKEFEAFLTENGGSVDIKDMWGKKDLAYKIKQYEQGIYVAYNVTLPSTFLQELDEHLRIHNDIMRFLVVSIKKGYTYEKPSEKPVEEELTPSKPKAGKPDAKTTVSDVSTYKASTPKKVEEEKVEDKKEAKEDVEEKPKAKPESADEKEEKSKSLDDKLSSILNDELNL